MTFDEDQIDVTRLEQSQRGLGIRGKLDVRIPGLGEADREHAPVGIAFPDDDEALDGDLLGDSDLRVPHGDSLRRLGGNSEVAVPLLGSLPMSRSSRPAGRKYRSMNHRHFASDNGAGAHPEVLAALAVANAGHVTAYGADPLTDRAIDLFRDRLSPDTAVFFAFNGTGANVVALAAALRPHQAVIAPAGAHLNVDECGALERFAGSKIIAVPVVDGKLTAADVRAANEGDRRSAPRPARRNFDLAINRSRDGLFAGGAAFARERGARVRAVLPRRRRAVGQRRRRARHGPHGDAARNGRRRVHVRRHEERDALRRGDRLSKTPSGGRTHPLRA